MIYGMNLLLWTTRLDDSHLPTLEALAGMGYGLVEVPVFDLADPDAYARLGAQIRNLGLQPSAVSALNAGQNIASDEASVRAAGEADIIRMMDCAAAMGAPSSRGRYIPPSGSSRAMGRQPPSLIAAPKACPASPPMVRRWVCASASSRSTASSVT